MMAFRPGDQVICGEILNTRRNSTHSWLGLRGFARPVSIQLTGNCDPDLMGRHIRFEVRQPDNTAPAPPIESDETENALLRKLGLEGLAWQQVGPTGTMTAARRVRVADCSTDPLHRRYRPGEPLPTERKIYRYLE